MREPIPSQVDSSVGIERTLRRSLLHNHLHDRSLGLVRLRDRHMVHQPERVVQGRDVPAAPVRVRSRLLGRVHVLGPSRDGLLVLVRRPKAPIRNLHCHLHMDRFGLCAYSYSPLQADYFHSGIWRILVLFDRSEYSALLAWKFP